MKKSNTDISKITARLEKSIESCLNNAAKINGEVTQIWTRRRQAIADSQHRKKETLLKHAKILTELLNAWKTNSVPGYLEKIRSASDIEFIFYHGFPSPPDNDHGSWYHAEYPANLKKATSLGITSKEIASQMEVMLEMYGEKRLTLKEARAEKLKEQIKNIRSYNIPGFYPTPEEIIDEMLEHAEINPWHKVLEPESGIGDIADKVCSEIMEGSKENITCCELNPTLAEILMLKGFHVAANDIYDLVSVEKYDRIIMNPPFEKQQDIDHVMFCFKKHLATSGRLVSVMSTSAMKGTTKKHIEFEQFRKEHHGYWVEHNGSFKKSFNPTGVNTVIFVVNK